MFNLTPSKSDSTVSTQITTVSRAVSSTVPTVPTRFLGTRGNTMLHASAALALAPPQFVWLRPQDPAPHGSATPRTRAAPPAWRADVRATVPSAGRVQRHSRGPCPACWGKWVLAGELQWQCERGTPHDAFAAKLLAAGLGAASTARPLSRPQTSLQQPHPRPCVLGGHPAAPHATGGGSGSLLRAVDAVQGLVRARPPLGLRVREGETRARPQLRGSSPRSENPVFRHPGRDALP